MEFRGDRRGQAIQIGAVLLLGAIVLSFAIYQSTVVPEQNREVEFQHSQTVQDHLQDARNGIVSTGQTGDGNSVSVTLGTQYPSRVIAMNPGPVSGTLATVGTTDGSVNATVANANATGETGDFWTGTNRSYNTGSLVYRPGYNEYANAPTTWYEHSVLFNQFRDANLTTTGQQVVDGTTISLVALNGSYQASQTGSVPLDFRGVSTATRTVSVTNETADSNVTITLPTRLDEDSWKELLNGEPHVANVTTSAVAGEDYQVVRIVLDRGETYDLRLSRVGLGADVVKPESAYLTRVSENTPNVPEGGEVDITVEVRDRFNNPKRDVPVVAGARNGSVAPNETTSDGDGQVTVTYEAPNITGVAQQTDYVQLSLNASLSDAVDGDGFNGSTPVNVSVPVRVDNSDGSGLTDSSGGDGAYGTTWKDPSGQTGVTGSDGVYTVNASETNSVTLTGETTPVAENASMEFTLNDSSVGSLSPTINRSSSSGEATTTFTPQSNGSVTIFVSSGGSGDRLTLEVVNSTSSSPGDATSINIVGNGAAGGANGKVDWSVENTGNNQTTIVGIAINNTTTQASSVGGGNILIADGTQVVTNPIPIDSSTSDGTHVNFADGKNKTIAANGGTVAFEFDKFKSNSGGGGSTVDMTGSTIYLTLFLDDGSKTVLELNVSN